MESQDGKVLLFVYGTLKRGHGAHGLLTEECGARFLRQARTTKDYALLGMSYFPGMVRHPSPKGVLGELYELDSINHLAPVDRYEGVPSLFTREIIELEDGTRTYAYLYNISGSLQEDFADEKYPILAEGVWPGR